MAWLHQQVGSPVKTSRNNLKSNKMVFIKSEKSADVHVSVIRNLTFVYCVFYAKKVVLHFYNR